MDLPIQATYQFNQPMDCCASGDSQDLTVSVEDGGGGCYLVLKTDRWAIGEEDIDAFVERLRWCLANTRSMFDDEEEKDQ